MNLQAFFGGAPILLAILMALTTARKWPPALNYVWAAVTFVFGIVVYAVL